MTNPNKKQLKITKLFRKQGAQIPEDCEELQEEINQLQQKLKDKQIELFRVQRDYYKHKQVPIKMKNEQFVRPEKIVFKNNIDSLERELQLMEMLTGMQVKSYLENDHCIIGYTMQHPAHHKLEHGLRINMKSDKNVVSKFSMPIGFNFSAVVEEFENVKNPQCLASLRKALVAYYERLRQFDALKALLTIEAQLFKIMDASHIEVSFKIQSGLEEDTEQISVVLMLDYRVYDIKPKQYSFKDKDLPKEILDVLKEQCAVFKSKPLDKAFKQCFLDGNGIFNFVHQVGVSQEVRPSRRQKRRRPARYDANNDDTFLPEECSSSGDEDRDERRLRKMYGRQ